MYDHQASRPSSLRVCFSCDPGVERLPWSDSHAGDLCPFLSEVLGLLAFCMRVSNCLGRLRSWGPLSIPVAHRGAPRMATARFVSVKPRWFIQALLWRHRYRRAARDFRACECCGNTLQAEVQAAKH